MTPKKRFPNIGGIVVGDIMHHCSGHVGKVVTIETEPGYCGRMHVEGHGWVAYPPSSRWWRCERLSDLPPQRYTELDLED